MFFSTEESWHQDNRARPLVQQYLLALELAVESHPELPACVVSCARCGIRFLTHRRNARRRDLGCPFGCREHRRRQSARQRSRTYYRTEPGRKKKWRRNLRRKLAGLRASSPSPQVPRLPSSPAAAPPTPVPPSIPTPPPTPASSSTPIHSLARAVPPDAVPPKIELRLEGVVLDESTVRTSPLLPYVLTVVNLLGGLRLKLRELVGLLLAVLRQRSMAQRRRRDYVLEYLHQHPP